MDLMDAFYFRIMQAVRPLGCGFLLLYFGVQYLRTQNRLRYAVPIRGNSHIDHWHNVSESNSDAKRQDSGASGLRAVEAKNYPSETYGLP